MYGKILSIIMSMILILTAGISCCASDSIYEGSDDKGRFIGLYIDNDNDIDSLEELENAIEEISEDSNQVVEGNYSELVKIVENTDTEVLEEYVEECYEDIDETLCGQEFVLDEDTAHAVYEMNTENGGRLTVELRDSVEENVMSGFAITAYAEAAVDNWAKTKFKKPGSYSFTGSCYYQSGFVAIRLKTKMYYKVTSDRNIIKNGALEIVECSGMFLYCINEVTCKEWEKKEATKEGNSIRCKIEVTSHLGVFPKLGIEAATYYYYAKNSVKLKSRTTKDGVKGVKVVESLKWT